MVLRVAIGCCNHLFGEGVKSLLEDEPDIEIIGIFNGDTGFQQKLEEMLPLNPDVILADYHADCNVLANLPEDIFNKKNLKIIYISDRTEPFYMNNQIKDLILKGVVCVLPPGADSDLLKTALKAISSKELWIDRDTLMKILAQIKHPDNRVTLSKREREIMLHICHGYRNKEIAQKLNIGEQTVKSHCNRIYKKLGVSDRLQLLLLSYKIQPDHTMG